MQKVTKDILISKAAGLLDSQTVTRVLGWKRGEFYDDVTPAVFHSREELENGFVFDDFCGANLSKYLIKETAKDDGKILVFLKPCDTYSFNQLLTERRFPRDKVYALGVGCEGMLDSRKIRAVSESVISVRDLGNSVEVETLYDGILTLDRQTLLPDRCQRCKSKKHVAFDELIATDGKILDSNRFDEVEKLEKMTADERYRFWQEQLSRCIRCNACRDVCPACTCEKCVFDNPDSGVANKACANEFEEKMFHIVRAFHVVGRCTDCGECSRVCPQNIPLHLLNRKFIKDINTFYGTYQAGETVGSRAPLVDYNPDDAEPSEVLTGGTHHV
ncbi:MAG: 4Fe-4S dicluster domain-containing protein [Clostridia bacterium]|nr:4Fe-4S dicluster domain-containing protein [Clostridia bacterium]